MITHVRDTVGASGSRGSGMARDLYPRLEPARRIWPAQVLEQEVKILAYAQDTQGGDT